MKMLPKFNLGVLSLAVLFLMVISAANGRKYMGEYWGEKSVEGLVGAKWDNGQKYAAEYWAAKALETLNHVKHDFEPKPDFGGDAKYFLTDFRLKPTLKEC